VPIDSATYHTGGEEEPGRPEKLKLDLPPNIRVQPIPERDTLAALLRDGGIDALYTARMPSSYKAGGLGNVRRLFESYMEIEQAYYRKTKIFPIMHTVAIRRSLYEQYPWVAMSLYKAFVQAQRETYDDLYVTAALKAMLPWLTKHVEDARGLMGDDFWPYGFAPNRETLATFLRYHHEQGLSKRRLEPEELFAPETMESFKI
jgi:4,5-dihydroxyphthalate decarboxylase